MAWNLSRYVGLDPVVSLHRCVNLTSYGLTVRPNHLPLSLHRPLSLVVKPLLSLDIDQAVSLHCYIMLTYYVLLSRPNHPLPLSPPPLRLSPLYPPDPTDVTSQGGDIELLLHSRSLLYLPVHRWHPTIPQRFP
jgi:hypothetical protein